MKPIVLIASAALLSVAVVGCSKSKDEETKLAPAAATLEVSKTPAAASAKVVTFAIDRDGKAMIDMPAPKEHIKASTTVAGGSLEVDLMNLSNTRGEVRVDLTTLTTTTFGDKDKDEAQTEHARTWLEATKIKEEHRWTVFAIRSIDGVSQNDVAKISPTREGNEDVRTAMLTAHGDFLLHGRKNMKDAMLIAKLHYPMGAAADSTPTSIEIKTASPLTITLADHDVKPRDTFGKLAKGSFTLLGTKVAETASVSLDLHASAKSTKS